FGWNTFIEFVHLLKTIKAVILQHAFNDSERYQGGFKFNQLRGIIEQLSVRQKLWQKEYARSSCSEKVTREKWYSKVET
ncbi:hypothetical protein MKW98_030384, partial [Papaver atlanticum]